MTKEEAYVFGFIWADGWIRQSKYHNEIRVECIRDDMEELYPYFLKQNPSWKIYYRNREGRKPQARLTLLDKKLVNYLVSKDYLAKSNLDAIKILADIPEKYIPYWYRGLIDGDGCWYFKEAGRYSAKRKFEISSSYNQDWSFFKHLLDELNINYQYYKISNKSGNSSRIEFSKRENLKMFGNYIYSDFLSYPMRT